MRRILPFIFALSLWATAPLQAADTGIQLNFSNADIESVVKVVSDYTGRTFIIDPRVKGTINIVSSKPVPRAAIYPALLSALRMGGFAVVESGGTTKILPEIEAKTYAVPPQGAAAGTTLTTRIFTLTTESAPQVLAVIKPLIAPNNSAMVYAPTNSIIVTDYADNLRRIETLIQSLDLPDRTASGDATVVVLKHAMAADVAQLIRNVMPDSVGVGGAAPEGRDRVSVGADARLNAVILRADNPARLARAQALIAQLDQAPSASAGASSTGNVHIIRLKNADAAELAQTLRRVLGAESPSGGANPASSAPSLATALSLPSVPAAQNGGLASALSGISAPSAAPTSAPVSFSANGATIFADAGNNTLIINAPEAIARNLRGVIEQLDVRRAQVYIEALIVELTAEKASEFGLQWQALSGLNSGDFRLFGGTNTANPAAIGATSSNVLGLAGAIGQSTTNSRRLSIGAAREINIPGVGIVYSLAALARALEKDAKGNVLSMPTLLTLDNHEANFSAGQNLPFVTGQYAVTGSATTPTPFQTIERRDVGLTLRVKPQIMEGGTVKLAIYQEVSSVVEINATAGIITNKRAVDTNAFVEDGMIVALGGLMQDSLTDGEDKVPLLGDVPLLGSLFKYDTRKRSKTSLMVFLRPTILRTAAQTNAFSQDRYDQLLGQQNKSIPQPTWFWPDSTAPALPNALGSPVPAAQRVAPVPAAP